MVVGSGYVRRCRKCMEAERFDLPELSKKVLYLDQFAISNMMKALHPNERDRFHSRTGEFDFWLGLFERIDRLVKLQVLICPSSIAHWEESLTTRSYEDLRRMYEHLSGGVSFKEASAIRNEQTYRQFRIWRGESPEPLTVHRVTDRRINRWLDRISVQAKLGMESEFVDDLRTTRANIHVGLANCVNIWKSGERLGFDHYFDQELSAHGAGLSESYWRRVAEFEQMENGERPLDPNLIFEMNDAQILRISFKGLLEESGVPKEEQSALIEQFYVSDELKQAPFLQISCAMFATMAVEASLQQAPTPDKGMWTDISTVSTVLPYCDAIFIDNRCHRLLASATDSAGLKFETRVFSTASRNDLVEWLDDLENSIDSDHRALVASVYGEAGIKPYSTMFEMPTSEPSVEDAEPSAKAQT
jgi:hypothetical protein